MGDPLATAALPALPLSLAATALGITLEALAGPGSLWGISAWIGALGIIGTGLSGGVLVGKIFHS